MSSKETKDVVVVEVVKKPKKKVTCKSIIAMFYDKEEGTVFGRTGKDWVYLLIFFIFFYVILFGYFTLLLFIFISGILTPNVPFRTGFNSIIGANPNMVFRPLLDNNSNVLSLSIVNTSASFISYSNNAQFYLNTVIPAPQPIGIQCNSNTDLSNQTSVCMFNIFQLGPCQNVSMELANQKLCIFLKINNIYGWLPSIQNPNVTKDILVRCTALNSTDSSNIGTIAYYPSFNNLGVFANYYFPYLNQSTYWSPIVAVEFMNVTKGITVNVNCSPTNVNNIVTGGTIIQILLNTK